MKKLQHYTDQAVEYLRDDVGQNLTWYYTGAGEQPVPKKFEKPVRESNFFTKRHC